MELHIYALLSLGAGPTPFLTNGLVGVEPSSSLALFLLLLASGWLPLTGRHIQMISSDLTQVLIKPLAWVTCLLPASCLVSPLEPNRVLPRYILLSRHLKLFVAP